MKRLTIIFFILIALSKMTIKADEGMWIPLLLEKLNIEDMKAKGFRLSAKDIYDVNQACLKDAIIIFGKGCTGELISDKGLIITNHHCGYKAIQRHSSIERDYLTNGFWAMSQKEELSNQDLTATFLIRMEDVTSKVLKNITDNMDETKRKDKIEKNIEKIKKAATKGTHYEAKIKPFFNGNQYFLFINEVFKDIRLVGAPPSAIGKFGGDTDNWMWPRHTGDFSIFRIYANKENKPAEYSADNQPYKPKKHLKISLKGLKKGDFTMIFGYPGSTSQYLTSHGVGLITETSNPIKIKLRDIRLDIMRKYMEKDPSVRIKYASKNARVANSWKRWQGEIRGLKRLDAVASKKETEKRFNEWVKKQLPNKKEMYVSLLPDFEKLYKKLEEYTLPKDYLYEGIASIEIIKFAGKLKDWAANKKLSTEEISELNKDIENFYKDYYQAIDEETFVALMEVCKKNIPEAYRPSVFGTIDTDYQGSIKKFKNWVYANTIFTDKESFIKAFKNKNTEKITNDIVFKLHTDINSIYKENVLKKYDEIKLQTDKLYRLYLAGLMEMDKDKKFYPDANFTMRVAFGNVDGYKPKDGVEYRHYTTLKGIIEKDNPNIYDYNVPQKLRELYKDKNYGKYAENGEIHVAFIATNHTTGGNSGSPVLDAQGNLVGVNFDRCWEGTMSDIMFDPSQCRNIILDIRYALFLIDKMAGASYLINEMTIVE